MSKNKHRLPVPRSAASAAWLDSKDDRKHDVVSELLDRVVDSEPWPLNFNPLASLPEPAASFCWITCLVLFMDVFSAAKLRGSKGWSIHITIKFFNTVTADIGVWLYIKLRYIIHVPSRYSWGGQLWIVSCYRRLEDRTEYHDKIILLLLRMHCCALI